MEIRSLVGNGAVTCSSDLSLSQAAHQMIAEGVGSLGVMDGETLAGIITERDILRAAASGAHFHSAAVSDWMTPSPDVLGPDADVVEAAQWMLATGFRHIPVVDAGLLLGIVSIKDVLWALTEPAVH